MSKGVIRVELAKHFIPHHEIEELEESDTMDGQIHIEIDDTNYAQLRTEQKRQIRKSFSKMQKDSSNLL